MFFKRKNLPVGGASCRKTTSWSSVEGGPSQKYPATPACRSRQIPLSVSTWGSPHLQGWGKSSYMFGRFRNLGIWEFCVSSIVVNFVYFVKFWVYLFIYLFSFCARFGHILKRNGARDMVERAKNGRPRRENEVREDSQQSWMGGIIFRERHT